VRPTTFSCKRDRGGPVCGSTSKPPSTLIRKQVAMVNQTLNRRRTHQRAESSKPVGLNTGLLPGPLPREDGIRCLRTPAPPPAHQPPLPEEAAPTLGDLEDVLVADPRGGLAPAQQVELKLQALLAAGRCGSFNRAAGKATNIRR
jgi:hypothetical protein